MARLAGGPAPGTLEIMLMKTLPRSVLIPGCLTWLALTCGAADWPMWRGGVDGGGITTEKRLPLRWSPTENVRWRVPLPERGNSTPVVWGDRVFVTQPIAAEHRRTLMCFHRADGRLLWQSGVVYDQPEKTINANPYCSASPATDGERVIVNFASAGVWCFDFQGKELWRRDLGKLDHIWGYSASPLIQGDLCFVYHGPGSKSSLVALDKHTGRTVWEFNEPVWATGDRIDGFKGKTNGVVGSFSTPILIKTGGQDELIMSFPQQMHAFEPKTGRPLWQCDGLNPLVYTSPIHGQDVVVAMGGYSGNTIAVKTGGRGNVTATHRLWQHVRGKGGIGTGVIRGDYLYFPLGTVSSCLELKTGKVVWEERPQAPGPKTGSWSSMILAGDRIYLPNQSGDVVVIEASPTFKQLAVNSIKEPTNSSLVVSQGDLFFRTEKSLWCFSEMQTTASVK